MTQLCLITATAVLDTEEPNVNEQQSSLTKLRQKLLISIAITALLSIVLGATYLHIVTERHAIQLTQKEGERFALQSSLLIRPLILANDRVSLNFLLNELSELPQLNGIQIQDSQGIVIARAGTASDLKQIERLHQQEQTIATLTLWLDPNPMLTQLRHQHVPILLLASLSFICLLLLTVWVTRQQTKENEDEESFELGEDFSTTLSMETQQYEATTSHVETEQTAINEFSTAQETHTVTEDKVDANDASHLSNTEAQASTEPENIANDTGAAQQNAHTTDFQTASLVDLLKPSPKSEPLMPKFEHHPEETEQVETKAQDRNAPFELQEQEISAESATAPESHTPAKENPLFKLDTREEVQLDLYSFEHELELILPPQEAVYLFYIDTNSASSENMKLEERHALIKVYLHLAKQVARIYNGAFEQLDNKDIVLRFELRDDQDSHGVNAICAGMLFLMLYKGFNQSRIKSLQPILSLQMSLARGHNAKYELVKEEAHFLTRTTQSNELISHTALTEAPLIKQSVLANADIRREDEDKVLILKVAKQHHTLLQKQANHLLTKLFKK